MSTTPTENLSINRLNSGENGIPRVNQALNDLDALVMLNVKDRDLTTPPVQTAAQGTLTVAVQPTNGDTMTIDAKVYTFQSTLTDVDGNIEIGSDLATTQTNIENAVNLTGTPGTGYAASMTIHPTVSAGAFSTNDSVLTAKTAGASGNSIATTETFTSGSNVFDAATLGTTTAGVLDDGEVYIPASGASGDWASHDGGDEIAYYYAGWNYKQIKNGWRLYVEDEDIYLRWNGTALEHVHGTQQLSFEMLLPSSGQEATVMYFDKAVTISEVRAVRQGGTAISWNLVHDTSRAGSGNNVFTSSQSMSSTTTGSTHDSGFNDETIPAGSYLWFDTVTVTGIIDFCHLQVYYTQDT